MTDRVFIDQGRISRLGSPRYSVLRIAILLIALATLFATNPANSDFVPRHVSEWTTTCTADEGYYPWLPMYNRQLTNYVVFSLEKHTNGVSVLALAKSFPVCRFHSDKFVRICEWIADSWCHEKPILDQRDRPYTAYRILSGLLIGSWLLSIVESKSEKHTIQGLNFGDNFFLNAVTSVLYRPNLIVDLVHVNRFMYPAFQSIDRLASTFTFAGNTCWNFYFCVVVLVFGIGAFCNSVSAYYITQQSGHGIGSSVAASLGCLHALSSRRLLPVLGFSLSPVNIIWCNALLLFVSSSWTSVVAWLSGGIMGYVFGCHLFDQLRLVDKLWLY